MTRITYAICVCDEHRELDDLLFFLTKVKEPEDDINILVDTGRVTDPVRHVLEKYKDQCTVNERKFCGNFSDHRNYHQTLCSGDYIFVIDADEMPQEVLLKNIKQFQGDILAIPRINMCPGYTSEWLQEHKFAMTNTGWINWPDFQMRYYKNDGTVKWTKGLHEHLTGGAVGKLDANPELALLHIKSVQRQDKQDELYKALES